MKKPLYIICTLLLLAGGITASAQDAVAPAQAPKMAFVNRDSVYDFGGVPRGLTVSYDFEIRNAGSAPLVISGMSCESKNMRFKWSPKAIKPGKKGHLTVTFTSKGEIGSFDNNILVSSNAWPGAAPIIRITGAITPEKSEYMPPAKHGKNQVRVESTPSPLVTTPDQQ